MKRFVAASAVALLAMAVHPALSETTLHVMSWQTAYVAGTPYWDKTIAGFEAENPGVKVESNFVAFSQYLPTLTAMIAGGSLPDVFNGGTKTGELGRAGLLVNFKDVFDARVLRPVLQGTASPVHLRRQALWPRRHGAGLRRLHQRSHHEGSRA